MEKDWKLFRKKLGSWQEAYMDKLVEEYCFRETKRYVKKLSVTFTKISCF